MTEVPERYVADIRLIRGRATHVVVDTDDGSMQILCHDERDALNTARDLNEMAQEHTA